MEVLVLITACGFVALWLNQNAFRNDADAVLVNLDTKVKEMADHTDLANHLKVENYRLSRRLTLLEQKMDGLYASGELTPH